MVPGTLSDDGTEDGVAAAAPSCCVLSQSTALRIMSQIEEDGILQVSLY